MSDRERFYRTLLGEALDVIVVLGQDGAITYASPSLERVLGYRPDQLMGRVAFELVHPDDLADVFAAFTEGSQEAGTTRRMTLRFSHQNGSWRTLEAVGRNLFDDPAVRGAVINARDVTERHEAENRFRTIFETEPECVKVVARDGTVVAMNPAGLAMLEARECDVLGKTLTRHVLPEYHGVYGGFAQQVFDGREAQGEFGIVGLAGTRRWVHCRAVPLRDTSGDVTGLLAITHDITARRRAELVQAATYRISEATHQARDVEELLAEIHAIVAGLMPARNFYVALYDETTELLTFPYFADEHDRRNFAPRPLGRGITEYVLRTGRPLLADESTERALLERGEIELVGTSSVQWLGVPLQLGGRVTGVVAVQSYDASVRYSDSEREILEYVSAQVASAIERKRAAQALAESHDLLQAVIEGAPDPIFAKDLSGRYLLNNSATLRLLGRRREELDGKREAELFPAERVAQWQESDRRILATGKPETSEWTENGPDGSRELHVTKSPLRDRTGQVFGILGMVRDVTDRRRLETQLRQAQKMEAIGQLAGGVAHDFNNLLTAITGYTDLLLDGFPESDPRHNDLEQIRASARRAAGLTQQLLAFSRKQVMQPKVLDLNAVVTNIEGLLRRLIGEHIALESRLADSLGRVQADPGQIEQVIVNLAVNARDAMPDGGTLRIETADAEIDASYVADHQPIAPGRYVRLTISDTGTGMDAVTRSRLFEPFFTTKEVGKGTGLGLATVYGVVKQSGGYIWVYSEVSRGSTFKIFLPRVDAALDLEAGRASAGELPRGSETILLAEDEPTVRTIARTILCRQGFRVLEAATPALALEMASAYAEEIHLLLTDVVMPGMSGRALADLLIAKRPGLRVLFVSGYTDDAIVHHGVLDPDTEFLQKPFTPAALAQKVRAVLDR